MRGVRVTGTLLGADSYRGTMRQTKPDQTVAERIRKIIDPTNVPSTPARMAAYQVVQAVGLTKVALMGAFGMSEDQAINFESWAAVHVENLARLNHEEQREYRRQILQIAIGRHRE